MSLTVRPVSRGCARKTKKDRTFRALGVLVSYPDNLAKYFFVD